MSKPRVIAFYLPQFHPIPENDKWWGKGFTEWTNVARAKPLFPGHYQPHIPADLGFYDLRVPEVREEQAKLAKEAGIEGFCYYHYWFGNKNTPKELMQLPFNEVVKTGKPDFPFCLCWANHSWEKRDWNAKAKYMDRSFLVEQKYYGIDDYTEHFYSLLQAFKDERYIKVKDKLLFIIYAPEKFDDIESFFECWNGLARENGLPGFFFVGYYSYGIAKVFSIDDKPFSSFDAKVVHMLPVLTNDIVASFSQKVIRYIKKTFAIILKIPIYKINFEKAIKKLIPPFLGRDDIIPELICGFDHSPRTGAMRLILHRFTPESFRKHIRKIFMYQREKSGNYENIIFLKSWNEWGEGNHMEPDLRYGHQFLDVLRKEIDNF